MSFANLGLSIEILKALRYKNYTDATDIQKRLIPAMFTRRDILAGAQTGTGKTAAFALPIIDSIAKENSQNHYPRALIIAPTRELANQIYNSIVEYSRYLPIKSTILYGGVNIKTQANRLKDGVDIVIATSGRLIEHINQSNISLEKIEYLVLDEADTVLDMGFLNEISQILSHLPTQRQNILISATLSGSVKKLSQQILTKPILIEVDSMGTTARNTVQIAYPVIAEKKSELLSYLIGSRNYKRVLVFVRKKELVDKLRDELTSSGLHAVSIHGDMKSGARAKSLAQFKSKKARVLVATDITARGIDIPELEVVINYDIPHVKSDYIHRIGRTGRAGNDGLAITLISPDEYLSLKDLERVLGKAIPKEYLDGYAPEKSEKVQKGARSPNKQKLKTAGAFGKKKKPDRSSKKRKTTKRDAWKR